MLGEWDLQSTLLRRAIQGGIGGDHETATRGYGIHQRLEEHRGGWVDPLQVLDDMHRRLATAACLDDACRQRQELLLARLDLSRVIEIHLAGGRSKDRLFSGEGQDVFNSTDSIREMIDRDEDDGIRITLDEAPSLVREAVLDLLDGNDFRNLVRESDDGDTVFELEWDAPGPHSESGT